MGSDRPDRRFASIGGNRNITEKNLLEAKLAEVEIEMARLEAQITEFQQRYGTLDIVSLARSQVTMLAELRSQLILKEVEINTYSEFAAANDPVLRRLLLQHHPGRPVLRFPGYLARA